jgi:hypothetical protein
VGRPSPLTPGAAPRCGARGREHGIPVEHRGAPAVSREARGVLEGDLGEQLELVLLSEALAAALAEGVQARTAHVVERHVLDDAEVGDLELAEHLEAAHGVEQGLLHGGREFRGTSHQRAPRGVRGTLCRPYSSGS